MYNAIVVSKKKETNGIIVAKKTKNVFVPKDAINRIHIGHAFAEYDLVRENPSLLVQTPAVLQATSNSPQKCFFVGRRGTGKTAITYLITNQRKNTLTIKPQVIAPDTIELPLDRFRDTNQPPFKSLVLSFKKAILLHVLQAWRRDGLLSKQKLPRELSKELDPEDQYDFDLGLLAQFERILTTLSADKTHWLKEVKRLERFLNSMEDWRGDSRFDYLVLFDSVDEAWDGSDRAVIFLTALMHACVDLFANCSYANAFLFLRENVFDRVRQIDNEYSRLETFLVSLDWHETYLLELVERRLNFKLTQKLKQDGSTWRHFFEDIEGETSWNTVVHFCRHRPRDLLAYVGFCLDIAQAKKNAQVTIEDMQAARRRFSENRLKDIGDEYAENYPHLGYVLNLFYGLGRQYSLNGLTSFIAKLVVDPEATNLCGWVLMNSSPEKFADILYRIGFIGYVRDGTPLFRGVGSSGSQIPPVTSSTIMEVHPTFAEALALQDLLIDTLDDTVELAHTSVIAEIPEGISQEVYVERLEALSESIKTVEVGADAAGEWEDIVGETIRLCFFPWLGSLEAKSRTVDNRVVRDWVASNLASGGFWEAMRQRYNALNIVWECKNYEKLSASDFHQANYYVSELSGLVIIAFRGPREEKKHYLEHIRRISSNANGNAIVLLANEQDLQTFIRQCRKGQFLDTHVRAIYDWTIRAIS